MGQVISQIGLAIFFQVFLQKARSATIIGYLLSVMTSLVAITINVVIYPGPYQIPFSLRLYPPSAFARLLYVTSLACSIRTCFDSMS